MLRLNLRPRTWGLRGRLLVPFIVITIGAVGALIVTAELSARGQDEALIRERGAAVLDGVVQRLQERQRSMEILTQLLAQQSDVVTAVEARDDAALGQEFMPLADKLELGAVGIYGADQEQLLHLGPTGMGDDTQRLIVSGLSGRTDSTIQVSDEGLAVQASSPIEGSDGIVGALVANAAMGTDTLREATPLDGAQLAVFRDGTLVSTSASDPELINFLRDSNLTSQSIDGLNRAADAFNFQLITRPLGDLGVLVALIPSKDIQQGVSQSNLLLLTAVLPLAVAILSMLLVAFTLARDMGATFEAVVKLSRELVRGNYSQRLPPSHIREVNELSRTFNFLGMQLEVQRKKLELQAFFDPLTGLPNRDLFVNRLKHALARAARSNSRVAVMFIDLDDFKLVNDRLGHQAGDLLLAEVGKRLQLSLREVDTAARLGGDEFTVLIEDASDKEVVIGLAERLQDRLGATPTLIGQSVSVRASIGIAFSSPDHDRPEVLLREADAAMYRAKLGGKARCEVFDDTMDGDSEECSCLTSDPRQELSIESKLEPSEFPVHTTPGYRSVMLSVWAREEGLVPGVTPDLLANCLADVKSGRMTLEECLNVHPAEAEELRRLMETATGVLSRPQAHQVPAFQTRGRASLVEAVTDAAIAARRSVDPLWRSIVEGWGNLARPIASEMPVPALVIGLVLILTTAAGGGATYAAQSALPGDPLYPVKMAAEGIQLRLAPGDEGKTQANLDCAGRRLNEAERAIEVNRFSTAESAIEAYTICVAQAEEHLNQAAALGQDVSKLAVKVSEDVSGQQASLEAVEDRLPEPARGTLAKATEETGKELLATIALAGRKPANGDRAGASPTLPPDETVATSSAVTPNSGRDEGGPEQASMTAVSTAPAVALSQTISDVQTLKNDPEIPGESHGGLLARLLAGPEAIDQSHDNAAFNQLEASLSQLNAMERSGHVNSGDYAALYSEYGSLVSQLGGRPGPPAGASDSAPTESPHEKKPQPGDQPDDSGNRLVVVPTAATRLPASNPGEQNTLVASPTAVEVPGPYQPNQKGSRGRPDSSQPEGTPVAQPTNEPPAATPVPDTNTHDRSGGSPDAPPAPVADPATPPGPAPQAPAPPSTRPDRPQTDGHGNPRKP